MVVTVDIASFINMLTRGKSTNAIQPIVLHDIHAFVYAKYFHSRSYQLLRM